MKNTHTHTYKIENFKKNSKIIPATLGKHNNSLIDVVATHKHFLLELQNKRNIFHKSRKIIKYTLFISINQQILKLLCRSEPKVSKIKNK